MGSIAAAVVELVTSRNWRLEIALRRRYFWAVRTIGAAISARTGAPAYSSASIEEALCVPGLGKHIEDREVVSYAECQKFGEEMLVRNSLCTLRPIEDIISFLEASGDIGESTVKMFELHEAQELGASALYS